MPDARPHEWADHYGVFLPDGSAPFPREMYPVVRALNGEECDDVEMLIRNPANPDGARISVSGRPVRDRGDEIVGAAVIFRDVTRLREAERKLWSTLTELERVQEEKEEFTDFKPIVLQDLLDEVAAAPSGRMRVSRMHFDRSGLQGQAEVLGDRELLHRVFTNVIDNCIKYGPEGGQLWLTATGESVGARFCVELPVAADAP